MALPEKVIYDYHNYDTPDALADTFFMFNSSFANSTNPLLLGETSAIATNQANSSHYSFDRPMQPWATWIGSVGEAIYLLGAESNSAGIIGATYAPILQNLNNFQWTPDLVSFGADPAQDVLSTSYKSISLLSSNRATQIRPINTTDTPGPAYWVAGDNTNTGAKYLKVAVYNSTASIPFSVTFDGLAASTPANLTVLTAPDPYAQSIPGSSNPVMSNVTTLTADANGAYSFELPELSIAVLATADKDGQFSVQGGFGGYGGCRGGGARASYDWTSWIASGTEGNGC